MRVAVLGIYMTLALLAGCSTNYEDDNDKVSFSKPDYKKAALLNVKMGETYLADEQYSRAKTKLIHALKLQPQLPEVHSALGYYYESIGEIKDAEQHYKRAVSLGSNNGRYHNNFGTFLCRNGKYKAANDAFMHALKDKQYIQTAEVFENAGICAQSAQDLPAAYSYLSQSLRHDPTRNQVHLPLAKVCNKLGKSKEAQRHLQEYRQYNPINPQYLVLFIAVNQALGNKDEISSAELKLKNLYANSSEAQNYFKSES